MFLLLEIQSQPEAGNGLSAMKQHSQRSAQDRLPRAQAATDRAKSQPMCCSALTQHWPPGRERGKKPHHYRTTELLGLEGSSGDPLVQPSAKAGSP